MTTQVIEDNEAGQLTQEEMAAIRKEEGILTPTLSDEACRRVMDRLREVGHVRPCPVRTMPARTQFFSPADMRYTKAKTAILTVRDRLEERAALDRPLTAGQLLTLLLDVEHERRVLDGAVSDS